MLCPVRQSASLSSSPLPSPSQLLGNSIPLNGDGDGAKASVDLNQISEGASSLFCKVQSEIRTPPPNFQKIGLSDGPDSPRNLENGQRSGKKWDKEHQDPPTFKKPPLVQTEEEPAGESEPSKDLVAQASEVDASDTLPSKKSRKRKGQTKDMKQRRIKKPLITKPGSIRDIAKTKKCGLPKRPKDDRSPERLLSDAVAKRKAQLAPEELANLGLEEATRRKIDWTPVKDRAAPASTEVSPLANSLTTISPKTKFGSFLSGYRFAEQDIDNETYKEALQIQPDLVVAKKRKIDFVDDVHGDSLAIKISAAKPIKNKIQTITAKATEGFVIQDESMTRTLTEYFTPPPKASVSVPRRRRKTAKKASTKAETTRSSEKIPVVHSPETAMKATRDQNLVFGTSSQLAREESPTCIHEIQRVVEMSEKLIELRTHPIQPMPISLRASKSIALRPTRGLWSAAARNDGSLLEAEYMTLEDTPRPGKIDDTCTTPNKDPEPSNNRLVNAPDADLDVKEAPHEAKNEAKNLDGEPQANVEQPVGLGQQSLPRSVAEKAVKVRSKLTSPKKKAPANLTTEKKPNYQGFTDMQLRKEVKNFGFKKINDRKAMISILERCWENQKSKALQELSSNALIQQPIVEEIAVGTIEPGGSVPIKPKTRNKRGRPPKAETIDADGKNSTDASPGRKRGRPKKSPLESTINVKQKRRTQTKDYVNLDIPDDIYDSDPPTPSPPQRRNRTKQATALTLSPSSQHRSLNEPQNGGDETSKDHTRFLDAITRAVTTQPPTHDIKNPSWHERILMYEPIIIEDFASWLNVEGLAKISEDDEVSPLLVKEWCESRSICCLWRENLRGLPRARW